jgi:hypothetical protein
MSPSAFPDAMRDGDRGSNARSETPIEDDVPTPREEEKKDKDARHDSEGMFQLDS